jgi:hypothetical protein
MDDTNNTKTFSRDMIREAVMNSKAEEQLITAFGVQIAVRTPALRDLMQYRDMQNDENLIARAIVNNCYVPGSNDRIFEDTDVEVLSGLAYNSDMKKLNNAIQNVLGDDSAIAAEIEDNTKSNSE